MRYSALLLLFTLTRAALADPLPLTPIPAGEDKIASVREGQPAPFTGQVFDTPTAIRWANYLHQCHYRLGADVELQKKIDDADKKALETVIELQKKQYEAVTKDLQERLTKAETELASPPFYKQVWFGVTVGVVASIGLAAATAALVHATN